MKRPRRRTILVLAGVVGLFVIYLLRVPILCGVGMWLDVGERPVESDYVLILNGGEETRPFVAAALVRAGFAKKALVITSILSPDQQDGLIPPTHEIIREVLLRRGLRPEQITVFDRTIVNTYHEAESLGIFLDTHPQARVTIVTNHFHTRRARWIFSHVLADWTSQLTFVSAPMDEFSLEEWWRTPVGFNTVPAEYLRFAFYVVRYSATVRGTLLGTLVVAGILIVLVRWRLARRSHARSVQEREPGRLGPPGFATLPPSEGASTG